MPVTLEEVLALPYGQTSTETPADVDEANALPYTASSPFAGGFIVNDYRAQYQQHGQSVRWWKALSGLPADWANRVATTGVRYEEQTLAATVRVVFWESKEGVQGEEFGQINVGDTMIGCIPDEIELGRGDRVLALDQRLPPDRQVMQADGTLNAHYPAAILNIWTDDGVVDPETYTLDGREITWTGEAPEGSLMVEYQRHPLYEFRGELNRLQPVGSDGGRLPQRGALKLVEMEEEHGQD